MVIVWYWVDRQTVTTTMLLSIEPIAAKYMFPILYFRTYENSDFWKLFFATFSCVQWWGKKDWLFALTTDKEIIVKATKHRSLANTMREHHPRHHRRSLARQVQTSGSHHLNMDVRILKMISFVSWHFLTQITLFLQVTHEFKIHLYRHSSISWWRQQPWAPPRVLLVLGMTRPLARYAQT